MVAPSAPPSITHPQRDEDEDEVCATISTLHHDILQTHVLTRLDGPTLAALACTSSEFHALSAHDTLWQQICKSTWPSINHPLIATLISTFPSAHRSFFSDSYPLLQQYSRGCCNNLEPPFPTTAELISAVDIYYQNIPIFSKVHKTEIVSAWFLCSPFRVDLLEPKEFVPTWIYQAGEKDSWLKQLEENITLSWIIIDPKQKRAVNMSSHRPISVERHWLTGEVQVKFATVMGGGGGKGSEKEWVEFEVEVTCGWKESGGEVEVRDVGMGMQDMEGKAVTGKDGLIVLEGAMESSRKELRKLGELDGMKERYKDFLEMKREKKKRKQRRESVLDWVFIATGVTSFMAFWSFIFFV